MTQFDFAAVRRCAVSSVGALLLSATCIAGAVAPARAEPNAPAPLSRAPLTVADWQADVGGQLDSRLTLPAGALAGRAQLVAAVDLSFDRAGRFIGAVISRGSGVGAVDRQVKRVADGIAYPPLPAAYRGRAQTVTMQALFSQAAEAPARSAIDTLTRG